MIAIIIPYYKLTFFEATLQSLANQTDKRFKVYIGDDASPENPIELLEKYKGRFDFIYHRFETNLGGSSLTKQWDRCIALSANEEWIMILGDDDVLGANVVESFYSNLSEINKYNSSVVRFASQIINEEGDKLSFEYTHPKLEMGIDFINRKFSKLTRSSLSENIFKLEIVKQVKFRCFPLAWHSDDLAIYQFSNNEAIFSINDAVVCVRSSQFSITGGNDNIKLKSRATQEFILNFLFPLKKKLTETTIDKLQRKLDSAFVYDKSLNNYYRISLKYIIQFKLYELIRFNYIQIRYIWK